MAKKFFEVFTILKLSDDDKDLFEETIINNLVAPRRGDKLHIYLESPYIVPKDRIYAVETEIKGQYFKDKNVDKLGKDKRHIRK